MNDLSANDYRHLLDAYPEPPLPDARKRRRFGTDKQQRKAKRQRQIRLSDQRCLDILAPIMAAGGTYGSALVATGLSSVRLRSLAARHDLDLSLLAPTRGQSAQRLALLRELLMAGLSYKQVGEKLGLSVPSICRLAKAQGIPEVRDTTYRLSDAEVVRLLRERARQQPDLLLRPMLDGVQVGMQRAIQLMDAHGIPYRRRAYVKHDRP